MGCCGIKNKGPQAMPQRLASRPPEAGKSTPHSAKQQQEQARQATLREMDKREADVIAHEAAHAALAGGTPVFEYNSLGKIVGGSVPVSLNPGSRSSLETAMKAAVAPADPSGQDIAVYHQAAAMLKMLEARASQGVNQIKQFVRQRILGEQPPETPPPPAPVLTAKIQQDPQVVQATARLKDVIA